MTISFKVLTTMDEMKPACELIKKIWGEENGITPYLFIAQSHIGGLVLGAYKQDQLIGVSYGFPGVRLGSEPFFYSHILGVLPEHRGENVGGGLKRLQAEIALEKGYNQMTWTFDPLESLNAYLNIHKLGATSNTYKANFYGQMTDNLNNGIPSDRLLVDWTLENKNTEKKSLNFNKYKEIMKKNLNDQSQPLCNGWVKIEEDFISIAIPANIKKIKAISMEAAKAWRKHTKDAFTFYFKNNYYIADFHFTNNNCIQYYLLHKM